MDEQGWLTIPESLGIISTKAVLIPGGPFLMLIPVPNKPQKASASWLESEFSREELKALAEKTARKDAFDRARRRKQL